MKRSYWASTSTEELQATLNELEAKGPEEFAQLITDLYDEIAERSNIFGRELVTCNHRDCGMKFFYVTGRRFPDLCIDHAEEEYRRVG